MKNEHKKRVCLTLDNNTLAKIEQISSKIDSRFPVNKRRSEVIAIAIDKLGKELCNE